MKSNIDIFFLGYKFTRMIALPVIILFLSGYSQVWSQHITAKTELTSLEGFYQFSQNNDAYLEISAKDGQLMLTQLWDLKEILFNQKSELEFAAAENAGFTLAFTEDSAGAVSQVVAFGRDIWYRRDDYQVKKEELSEEETEALKKELNIIAAALSEAVNSNSPGKILAFLTKYAEEALPVNNMINPALNIYRSTGGIDLYGEASLQPGRRAAVYLFEGRSLGNFFEISIRLDQNNKIIMVQEREVRGPGRPAKKFTSETGLVASLKETLSELDQKDIFSGTVLLAKGNKILLEYACGEAIKPDHVKNTVNTRFNLGSMNKMFTATSIMQLAEQDKLKLTDPIGLYIDTSWLPGEVTAKVTIHHLLSHSSGLGDFFGPKYNQTPKEALLELNAYKPFIRDNTLAFEPGTSWAYSNSGMILLGVIIEKVSGMNYFDYVKQNIYKPAGMIATGTYNTIIPDDIAYGYISQADGSYRDNTKSSGIRGSSAGGGYSTIGDLHRFALSLLSNKLVTEASRALMFTDHLNRQYGYGFQLWNSPAGKVIGHSGGAPGINGILYSLPDQDYHIVVLTNYDRAAQRLGDYILKMLTEGGS